MSDVMMRANFGALERTADDWRQLLKEGGFKLEKIALYSLPLGLSLILAVLE